ncbi:MAG: hypothetical protein HOP30_11220 [Cyclobacteriaceae bacterium]|nr:hypothetical protein [Cyclobacteriaceae bacterium]
MQVRKTKSGKFVAELDWHECENLYGWLVSFLETESAALLFVKLDKVENFKRYGYYYAVNHFFVKYCAKLRSSELKARLTMKSMEAFTLLQFLWTLELPMGYLDIANGRSQLHQLLS